MNYTMQNELSTYFEIMIDKRPSRVKVASMIKAERSENIDSLWKNMNILI
jgi:hypothetical protein